jgi:hypothetical protein
MSAVPVISGVVASISLWEPLMSWPDEVFLSIRDDTDFTVTKEHLKLLRRARVSWDDAGRR